MKSRLITTGSTLVLLGALVPAGAGERVTKVTTVQNTRTQFSTSGFHPVHQFEGRLTLETAVDIALRQNPDILRAIQEIERTRGLIIEVRAQALPQITLTGSYSQQDRRLLQGGGSGTASTLGSGTGNVDFSQFGSLNNGGNTGTTTTTNAGPQAVAAVVNDGTGSGTTGNGTNGQQSGAIDIEALTKALGQSAQRGGTIQNKSWRVAVEARQVLYAGGQIRAALSIARLTEDSAYYQLRDTVDRIISQVRQQFYAVLANRALITVQEEAVNLAQQQLEDQRNRFEAGTVPRFNVLRAEVELANVQPNLIRARNDYLISQIQLAKLLALDPGPGGKPTFLAVGDLSVSGRWLALDDALMLARARRPFLKVQRQQILIEVEQIKVAQAGYKPRLDASVGYEIRNRSSSSDLGDTVNGYFLGVNGSWDIFDGFETFGQVKQARAQLQSAKITYEDAIQQVELEVQTAFANLRQSLETIQSQRKNVEQAREALRLAQERLAAGAGTQLEVLDARVALTRAQITELQARADYNRTLAEFDRATATDTVYDDTWRDPLATKERGIMEKIASIGLAKPGTAEFDRRIQKNEPKDQAAVDREMSKDEQGRPTVTHVETQVQQVKQVRRVRDGKSTR